MSLHIYTKYGFCPLSSEPPASDRCPRQRFLMYHLSYPLKEPGGHRLPAGRSGDALPGPHQAAWARVCAGGGSQGTSHKKNTTKIFSLCPQFQSFHFYLSRNGRASCRPPLWRKSWRAPQSKSRSFNVKMYSFTERRCHTLTCLSLSLSEWWWEDLVSQTQFILKSNLAFTLISCTFIWTWKPHFRGIFWVICSSQQRETRSTLCWITPPTSWT